MNHPCLDWKNFPGYEEALLGTEDDGVRFTLTFRPTCYRRGQYNLLIEVLSGPNHERWGCFDDQDQPERYYHDRDVAKGEAQRIAHVLWNDRYPERRSFIKVSDLPAEDKVKSPVLSRDTTGVIVQTSFGKVRGCGVGMYFTIRIDRGLADQFMSSDKLVQFIEDNEIQDIKDLIGKDCKVTVEGFHNQVVKFKELIV